MNDAPRESLGAGAGPAEPRAVALESLELARLWVYLNGTLPYGKERGQAATLPPGYDVASAAISRRRVAQAGYRMGRSWRRCWAAARRRYRRREPRTTGSC